MAYQILILLLRIITLAITDVSENDSQEIRIQINSLNYVNPEDDVLNKTLDFLEKTSNNIKEMDNNNIDQDYVSYKLNTNGLFTNLSKLNETIIKENENESVTPSQLENLVLIEEQNKTQSKEVKHLTQELKNEDRIKSKTAKMSKTIAKKTSTKHKSIEEESRDKANDKIKKGRFVKEPPRGFIGPLPKPIKKPEDKKIFFGPEYEGREEVSCEDIKNARFNPYSILNENLFGFYFWAPEVLINQIEFKVETTGVMQRLRNQIDNVTEIPVDWSRRHVIMTDQVHRSSSMLVEQDDRGLYWVYPLLANKTEKLSSNWYLLFKQSKNGKYLLMVVCNKHTAVIFSRYKDIPNKKKMSDAVASFGLTGGRSYLYQGHKWMPTEEMNELEYWTRKYGTFDHEKKSDEQVAKFKDWQPEKDIDDFRFIDNLDF